MRNVTFGIAHSGTNLIKNLFAHIMRGHPYVHLSHPDRKNNRFLYGPKRFDGCCVFFNYRNEFDRRLSTLIRGRLDEEKARAPGKLTSMDSHPDVVSESVGHLFRSRKELEELASRYAEVIEVRDTVKAHAARFVPLEYESFYDNFDFVCDKVESNCSFKVPKEVRDTLTATYSSEQMYKQCRTGPGTPGKLIRGINLHTNHVSTSRGEPYFWTRFVDVYDLFNSVPADHQKIFLEITRNHKHPNIDLGRLK